MKIAKTGAYAASHKLRDVIADNSMLLSALSRFEIPLGFGDGTVAEVCKRHGVDVETFLAVCNMISGKPFRPSRVNIKALITYLKNAHTYFLDYVLPGIRGKLIDALSMTEHNDVSLLLLKFYDDYREEVYNHMAYENEHVFTNVQTLLEGRQPENFKIDDFTTNHRPIATKLHELKDIIICHYTGKGSRVDLLNSVLFDIMVCENDLLSHCRVEDGVFVPAVRELEERIGQDEDVDSDSHEPEPISPVDNLTEREREIIACVARGLSNKEIADKLFLSVHTVATHRRNICSKLSIHSASGLTIFAIMHGLINLQDVKLQD